MASKIVSLSALIGAVLIFTTEKTKATHLRAADVVVERICGTLTFRITVVAYLNSESRTRFGTRSQLFFGDGASVTIPVTTASPRPDLGEDISVASYTTTHTFQRDGVYNITYIENDRSEGVANITDSEDTPYVTFVRIDTDPAYGCNHYPVLAVIPLDRACTGVTFLHNSGAYDIDGDSLSYELSVPANSATTQAGYAPPNDPKFYADYNTANEDNNAPPSFYINSLTGLVTWDAPGMIGEYNIAFKIIEWRKVADGKYVQVSSTTRDMQIVVEECDNLRPDLIVPNDTCVTAGTQIDRVILGMDPEDHPIKIEVFSEIFQLEVNPASVDPVHTDFVPSDPPAQINFSWKTDCNHVRQQVYQVVFKITDDPPDGPKLVSYKTWSIKVVAPAPVWSNSTLNVVTHEAVLDWEQYACVNASVVQVWRKVDSYPFIPANCQTGIPGNLGYQLISTVPVSENHFVDNNFGQGLNPGAKYCYRLVALVADTKSYVSDEICVGPVAADAPVITHVSVEKTAEDGSIRVSWRSPFNIDTAQFPKPYLYEIYRAEGFIGEAGMQKAGMVYDTTFLDSGLDSKNGIFNYRIVVYSKPSYAEQPIPVDTSSVASSVRLSGSPLAGSISLQWRDTVPWSNIVFERPYHLIYRGEGLESENNMELIDSALVTSNGFRYTDSRVREDELYSYKVVTRGSYGNPEIGLLENLSQVIYLYPENNLVACAPTLSIEHVDCGKYLSSYTCNELTFTNKISWLQNLESSCRVDIVAYNIYASAGDQFELLTTITSDTFEQADLSSMARCYKVSAVDSRGIEGAFSETVCNDNCPYFELPNVFSPNGDGCNELFTARYDETDLETSNYDCVSVDRDKCPRFVKSVNATIYNRWGKEVFHSSSDSDGSVFIDWDGRDNGGTECSTGVYYYTAEVVFDVLDVKDRRKIFKGWVHLIR